MTPDDMPKPPKAGESETDQAKRAVKNQAPDTKPDDAKPDEGTRPDQLTSENDGGAQGERRHPFKVTTPPPSW